MDEIKYIKLQILPVHNKLCKLNFKSNSCISQCRGIANWIFLGGDWWPLAACSSSFQFAPYKSTVQYKNWLPLDSLYTDIKFAFYFFNLKPRVQNQAKPTILEQNDFWHGRIFTLSIVGVEGGETEWRITFCRINQCRNETYFLQLYILNKLDL